jgi:MFS family permease
MSVDTSDNRLMIQPPDRPISPHTPVARSVAAATAALTLAALPLHLTGGLSVLMARELGGDIRDLALAVSIYFASSAICAIPAGALIRRFGASAAVRAAVVATAGCLVAIATIADEWATGLVILAAAGACAALIQVGTNVLLARRVPHDRQGIAFGVKMAAIPAAAILAGIAIPTIGLTVGWRLAFLGAAVAGLGVLVLMPPSSGARVAGRPPDQAIRRRRALILVAVGAGIGSAAGTSMTPFLVPYLVAMGHSPAIAGVTLAAASLTGAAARIALGWRADNTRFSAQGFAALALSVGALGCAVLGIAPHGVTLAVGVALAFGGGFGWAGLVVLAVSRAHAQSPAPALAKVQAATFSGAIVGPIVFGHVASTLSYPAAWALTSIAFVVAATTLWISRSVMSTPSEQELVWGLQGHERA